MSDSPFSHVQSSNSGLPEFPTLHGTAFGTGMEPWMPVTIPEPSFDKAPMKRISILGVPGGSRDLITLFDACVRVSKLDRAQIVLQRIISEAFLPPQELIILHNQFLLASIQHYRTMPDRKKVEALHRWYELEIHHRNLPQTAETIACMIKASLLSERGHRLSRLVRRYMTMAPGEAGLLVLQMENILSDEDIAVITRICPTYNFPEAEEPELGELEAQVEEAAARAENESDALPELRPTPQTGQGLKSLHRGLRFLHDLQDMDISKMSAQDQRDIQIQLERDSISSAIEKWRAEEKERQKRGIQTALRGGGSEGPSLSSHIASFLGPMERRIKEELVLVEKAEAVKSKTTADFDRCVYGPLLASGDPTRMAAVTILAVLNAGAMEGIDKGISVHRLFSHIGKLVQEDVFSQRIAKEKRERRKVRKMQYDKDSPKQWKQEVLPQPVEFVADPTESELKIREAQNNHWTPEMRVHIGSVLLQFLIEDAHMIVSHKDPATGKVTNEYQPAFAHALRLRRGKKVGVVIPNKALIEFLKREPLSDFLAKHLPMIVEPRPWKSISEGGFLEAKTSFIRVQSGDIEQRTYARAAITCGDMRTVFKGLDVLGKTQWRINNDVFKVMIDAWNKGEALANLPPLAPQFELPPEPDQDAEPEKYRHWVKEVRSIENERSGLHSQRCFMNLQLEVARAFRNQTIYFPHNVDYRGRAYPMPTYLNHMGADHTRGLLTFAQGKELGQRGLRWLKIHLANVHGLDKANFDDREKFADDNIENVRDSVNNPLGGNRWWLKAEDPWQCLAACHELAAAYKLEDPTKFVSHLPIQQDGTCNGLQHYAALGGDSWGAKQVNLEPGEKPADVYSAVANLVKDAIAKDIEAGEPKAIALDGKITRKVVKQTVMTNVYGVTFPGAKKQVCKQLDALYPNLGIEAGTNNLILASYVATKIFEALATMFSGAHDIQHWLGESGGRICRALTPAQLDRVAGEVKAQYEKSDKDPKFKKGMAGFEELAKSFRSTIVWTTPLRMPVVQPYRKGSLKEVRTSLQTVSFPVSDQTDAVNRKKQIQGFAPNFIHSLDASHMLLSALKCHDLGLSFAAVHDSFWTHAADVDVMNEVLRDAFIKIHEEDVVGRLAAEFEARHKGSIYLTHIDADSPVGKKIKELRDNSGLTPKAELLLEHQRNTLRLSGKPWDLAAAKQIITPASVYEDMQASEPDLLVKQELANTKLGDIDDSSPAEEDEEILSEETEEDNTEIAAQRAQSTAKKQKSKKATIPVWLPLTFPELPVKVRIESIDMPEISR